MSSVKTALLVVDVQVFFSSMVTKCLPNILKLCHNFSETTSPLPIIFTQHGHTKEELTTEPSPSMLVRRWSPANSIARGSEDWELVDEIQDFVAKAEKKKKGSSIQKVQKNTYDAFLNTDLASILEREKVERVVVTGCMTDCCCDTTARSAFNRGYETWMVSDACGTASKKQHEAGLMTFEFAFGEVLKTNDVLKRFSMA